MVEPNQQADAVIKDADLYQSFRLMKQKDFDGALNCLNKGLKKPEVQSDPTLQGLYFSALGVLYKLKSDYKKSYKFYQQAEKLLPDEGSLKIITAHLLIEEFAQYDTAIKKLDKILQMDAGDPAMVHHAKAAQGLAYLGMGKKDRAKAILGELIASDFVPLRSGANLDFKLVAACLQKSLEPLLCRSYLEKALAFVTQKKEAVYMRVIQDLISRLPQVIPGA
jgi:tetratricopeptide (TPR) repeat protein